MIRPILIHPDPRLKKPCEPVAEITPEIVTLAEDMLETIGKRLPQIQSQVEHFGPAHENVIAACGALYQDTLSTLRQRIQVHGDMRNLQQPNNASKFRALLLAGIRSARLWRQLGGHRWQLVISRRKLLEELYPMLRGN